MFKKVIFIAALMITFIFAGQTMAVQVRGHKRNLVKQDYRRATKAQKKQQVALPEIIHNPPAEIPSTKDFRITARIKNLGLGLPVIYYRFGNDKRYFKRALKRTGDGNYEIDIMSAALTDNRISYYIAVSTGSKTLANYGSKESPVVVKIIHPKQSRNILFAILLIAGVAVVWKFAANQKAYYRKERLRKEAAKRRFGAKEKVRLKK